MEQPSDPSPVTAAAQVGAAAAGKVLVRCAGCRIVMTVLRGLTEFVCPKCELPQMLPPALVRPSFRSPSPPEEANEPQSMTTSPAAECDDNRSTYPGSSIYIRLARDDDDSGHPEGDHLSKKEALKRISDNYMKLLKTETRKLCRKARDDLKGVWENEEELLNSKLKRRKQKLDSWSKELDKRQSWIEHERQIFELEKTEKDLRNSKMAEKLRETEENYRGLVERLKEKEVALSNLEDVHQHTVLKEKKSNEELQEVRLELVKNDLRNIQLAEKLTEMEETYRRLVERLKEKEVALPNLEDVPQHSVLKEQRSYEELQEVRLELVKLMSDVPRHRCVDFGVQRIGEIYEKAFEDACKQRFPPGEAEIKAVELRMFLEKILRENPSWQPFQIIEDGNGNPQGLLKTHDEQLRGLWDELGEPICNLVYTALIDLHKCNGSYKDDELWNLRENRKATLTEVIGYISTHLKTLDEESNMRKRLRRTRFVIKEEFPRS